MRIPNQTASAFDYPGSLIKEYEHWILLLRPQQVTLCSMVLITKGTETCLSELDAGALAELKRISGDLEGPVKDWLSFQKINYLALMMVDPHVHFHVLPRFDHDVTHEGICFRDAGWPGLPDFANHVVLEQPERSKLIEAIRKRLAH